MEVNVKIDNIECEMYAEFEYIKNAIKLKLIGKDYKPNSTTAELVTNLANKGQREEKTQIEIKELGINDKFVIGALTFKFPKGSFSFDGEFATKIDLLFD